MKNKPNIIFLCVMLFLLFLIVSSCNKSSQSGKVSKTTQPTTSVTETQAVVQTESKSTSSANSTRNSIISTTKRTTTVPKSSTTKQTKPTEVTKHIYLPYDAYDSKIPDGFFEAIKNDQTYKHYQEFYGVFDGKSVYCNASAVSGTGTLYKVGEHKLYILAGTLAVYADGKIDDLRNAYDQGFFDDEDAAALIKKSVFFFKKYKPNKLTISIADGYFKKIGSWKPEDFSGIVLNTADKGKDLVTITKVTDITKERNSAYGKSGMKRYVNKHGIITQYLEIEFKYSSEYDFTFSVAEELQKLPFVRSADVIYLLDKNGNYIPND